MRNDLKTVVRYFEMRWEGKTDFEALAMCDRREMERTALSALRDMLKRREGCDTCMKGQAMFGDVLWAINKDGKAVININGEQANTVFRHCPMCGRKLEEKK